MKRNWLEWLILAGSVAAILALVGYLVAQALLDGSPVSIRIEPHPDQVRSGPAGWQLRLTIANDGGAPAEAVVVEAIATVGDVEERSQLTVGLLPAHSRTEAVVGFSSEPDGDVRFRVVAYESP